jgi:hypothetical protein
MLVYISTYLIAALILEVIRRNMKAPLFIRTRLKHFPWKLNYSLGWWGTDEYLAAVTAGSFLLLIVFTFWVAFGSSISKLVGWGLWAIISISSSVLFIRYFKLIPKLLANIWWLTLLTALIAIGIGQYSSILADNFIVSYTRTDAGQFPAAQKAIGVVISVFLWTFFASLILGILAFGAFVILNILAQSSVDPLKHLRLPPQFGRGYKPGRSEIRFRSLRMIVLGGPFFTFLSLLYMWEFPLTHADEGLQETLVFSSFHLHPRDCAIPGMPQGARAALISEKQAVIAIPEAKGYVFETMPCDVQSTRVLEEEAAKRLKQDHYF